VQIPADDNALMLHDAPPWFAAAYAVLLQEVRDNRKEIELLREAVGCHVVSRSQAAAMLGKSEKTIKRMEDRGDLPRANVTAPGIHYDFQTVLDLQRASHNGSPR